MFRCAISFARITNTAIASYLANSAAVTPSINNNINRNYSLALSSATEPTFDFRRLRKRSEWGIPEDEDADVFLFPNERLGCNYELNWAFNFHRVTPIKEAYRNLHFRGLRMFCPSTKDKNNAVVVESQANECTPYVTNITNVPGNVQSITSAQTGKAVKEVRQSLSTKERLFMHDGAVNGVPIRVITDDPSTALYLHHVMGKARLGKPYEFEPAIVAYVTDDVEPSALSDFGIGDVFSILDTENNRVIIGGTTCPESIRNAIADIAGHISFMQGHLPLPASSLIQGNSHSAVVFGADLTGTEWNVIGSHDNTWSSAGLARNWGGRSIKNPAANHKFNAGDLIQKDTKNKSVVATTKLAEVEGTTTSSHPKEIIFVVDNLPSNQAAGVYTMTNKQASNLFKSQLGNRLATIDHDECAARFEDLLTSSKARIHVVKAKGKQVNDHISNILNNKATAKKLPAAAFK